MHAFGMSERYLILAEYPLRVNPLKLAFSGKPFIENYTWRADEPTRFQVFDRETGELRGTYETDAFFCFHHVNAFERGGELVVDLCAYEDSSDHRLALPRRRTARGARCRRRSCAATRSTSTAAACARSRSPTASLELPRIDYGAPQHARLLATRTSRARTPSWIDRLVKVDVRDGSALRVARRRLLPGRAGLRARARDATAEDAGVVLSVVLDANAGRSFLLVLDAGSFEELARAEAPHHIPFGFHGQFFR